MSDSLETLRILLAHTDWEYVNSALTLLDSVVEDEPEVIEYVSSQVYVSAGYPHLKNTLDARFPNELLSYFVHWLALYKPDAVQNIRYMTLGDLDEIPEGISHLPNIQYLDIRKCKKLAYSDFDHCQIFMSDQQTSVEFTELRSLFVGPSRNGSQFYSIPDLKLQEILSNYPKLQRLDAPAYFLKSFPSPVTIEDHPLEHLKALNCTLQLESNDGSASFYERVRKAMLPEEVINTFLTNCSNIEELVIMTIRVDSFASPMRTIPLQYCPKLHNIDIHSGTKADLIVQLNQNNAIPMNVEQWTMLLGQFMAYNSIQAEDVARKHQMMFADRWVAGDPSAKVARLYDYEPLMSKNEPLTANEKKWLSHFIIQNDCVHWPVNLMSTAFRTFDICYKLREQALLNEIPESQLCEFFCEANGLPVFKLNVGRRFSDIARRRHQYLERHYEEQIQDKKMEHFSLCRLNIPSGCLPADAISVELDAASFTAETLQKLEEMPSLERLLLNGVVTNSDEDMTLLRDYFLGLPRLKHLEICACGLLSLPAEIASLVHLEKLFLWGNQLSSLPDGLAELSKLKHLSISSSLLDIPDWIWSSSIKKLHHKGHLLSKEVKNRAKKAKIVIKT